jgi:hypothetical protein
MIYTSPKIKQYRRYRNAGVALHQKIIDEYVDDQIIGQAARELGLGENHVPDLEKEDELSILMEYALHEIEVDGMSLVEKYQKEVGGKNRVERELLSAKINAPTGLFLVEDIHSERCIVELVDLTDENREIELTDINFSQSKIGDVVLFFRPIELSEFTTTSGVSFVFSADMKEELKEKWLQWESLPSDERYAKIFKLHKSKGIPTLYV